MSPPQVKKSSRPRREQTDESLRIEREKSDAASALTQHELDDQADAVVQVAREREDEVASLARHEIGAEQLSNAEKLVAESTLDVERVATDRATIDAALKSDRAQQRRYFELFLANEREATDAHLLDERADADRIVASRDDFLATVSHDLRSLLGGLLSSAELMLGNAPQGRDGDLTRKCANTSKRLVLRMSRLVNDLLDMTSIEAGQVALSISEHDLTEILHDTLEAFEPIATARGIVLRGSCSSSTSKARFDGGRMLQVLANLVSNAIKFTASGGTVTIDVGRDERALTFAVIDTGVGIPENAQAGIFEKFKQVAKDRRGLGLGLHIARGIVEAHGGKVWVQSQVGVGSTFHVAIPNASTTALSGSS